MASPSTHHSFPRNDLRRRGHVEAEELKGMASKAVIPAMMPLQMSSPAYSFRSCRPSSCRRRLRMRSWTGERSTLSKSTESVAVTAVNEELQALRMSLSRCRITKILSKLTEGRDHQLVITLSPES